MQREWQKRAPFVEALEAYCAQHFTAFHTPGHKLGNGISTYQRNLFGEALRRDLGLMYALDDLFQPEGALKEAMALAADLYGAGRTFFSVNGTTACVEAMILAVCQRGDEIIIPREAHKSVFNGLILSGAKPVYMESRFAEKEQVSLGPDIWSLKTVITSHPHAKAVLFTYPTYDGIACSLEEMAAYAHECGLIVLVDEAHGAHLSFDDRLPREALACGADCVAQSTHKLAGSLTQTSMLHCRKGFDGTEQVAAAMSLVQSTSPHYWFLASLDSARQQLALQGQKLTGQAVELANWLRSELNAIQGIHSFGEEILQYPGVSAFDVTKVTIDFSGLGLDGRQAELYLRREKIEVEMTAGAHVLAFITFGDTKESAEKLLAACRRIAASHTSPIQVKTGELPLPQPEVVLAPVDVWHAKRRTLPLNQAIGKIAAETVMFYPPGIPALAMGERVTSDCVQYIQKKLAAGYKPNGTADTLLETIQVVEET